MTISLVDESIRFVHTLSAAAWFGALVYRAFFVEPKAAKFFKGSAAYEKFSLDLAHGMRYIVMSALTVCGLTGFVMLGRNAQLNDEWTAIMTGKIGLWLIAAGLFAYISWSYWPRRVFADEAEWPRVRRQGFILAVTMISIAGSGFLLGQWARAVRIG